MPDAAPPLSAFALNCSLRPSSSERPSSTDKMSGDLMTALAASGVTGTTERVADHDVKPDLLSDMGGGDDWPELRRRVLEADGAHAYHAVVPEE